MSFPRSLNRMRINSTTAVVRCQLSLHQRCFKGIIRQNITSTSRLHLLSSARYFSSTSPNESPPPPPPTTPQSRNTSKQQSSSSSTSNSNTHVIEYPYAKISGLRSLNTTSSNHTIFSDYQINTLIAHNYDQLVTLLSTPNLQNDYRMSPHSTVTSTYVNQHLSNIQRTSSTTYHNTTTPTSSSTSTSSTASNGSTGASSKSLSSSSFNIYEFLRDNLQQAEIKAKYILSGERTISNTSLKNIQDYSISRYHVMNRKEKIKKENYEILKQRSEKERMRNSSGSSDLSQQLSYQGISIHIEDGSMEKVGRGRGGEEGLQLDSVRRKRYKKIKKHKLKKRRKRERHIVRKNTVQK